MKGYPQYPQIGQTYLLLEQDGSKYLLWAVVENDFNYESTTLEVAEEGPNFGRTTIVSTAWINEQEKFDMIIEPTGKIIIADGRQFIKAPGLFPKQTKTL